MATENKPIIFEEDTVNPDIKKITNLIDKLSKIDPQNIKTFAAEKVEVEGVNIFDFLLKVKDSLAALEQIESDLKKYAIEELYKYKNQTYEGSGFVCRMMEAGTSYDYKQNEEWRAINEKKKEIEDRLKKVLPKKSTTTVKFERKRY